jgi:hypothetical protein
LSTKVTPLGKDPLSTNDGAGFPEVVTENVPFTPTVNVALLALVNAGGTSTVIITVAVVVAGVVAVLVTVNV